MSTAITVPDADHSTGAGTVTILVPIRYPVTARSATTLARADEFAAKYDNAHIVVLHINLVHHPTAATRQDLYQAITPIVNEHPIDISIRRGAIIEECILNEAQLRGADIIVIGANQKARWRRYLSRLVGNDPGLHSFLQTHAEADIEIAE